MENHDYIKPYQTTKIPHVYPCIVVIACGNRILALMLIYASEKSNVGDQDGGPIRSFENHDVMTWRNIPVENEVNYSIVNPHHLPVCLERLNAECQVSTDA